MNKRLFTSTLAGSFGGFLFGYDIGAMAGATPDLRACFALSPSRLGLAVSSALFGAILGSAIGGRAADAFGRRAILSLSGVLYAIAALAAILAGTFSAFTIGRFWCGISIGLISVCAPMYLAEIAPARMRGRIVGSFQLSVSLGVISAFLLGDVLSSRLLPGTVWRFLIGGALVPALLCEVGLLHSCPSPRWLVVRGRIADARTALADLGSSNPHLDANDIVASLDANRKGIGAQLFTRRHVYPIAVAVSIAVFNQLTGVNALLYYVLDVFKNLGSGQLNGRADAVYLSSLGLLVTILSVLVIDRLGRKPLILGGAAGMGLCLLLLPAIRQFGWPASAVVIVLACYNACFGFSQGSVIWVYLSEIFPLPVRARGQSLGTTAHWITNAFVVGAFPVITSRLGGKVFVGFAFLMALQFFTVLLLYPETKGKPLEQLARAFEP